MDYDPYSDPYYTDYAPNGTESEKFRQFEQDLGLEVGPETSKFKKSRISGGWISFNPPRYPFNLTAWLPPISNEKS